MINSILALARIWLTFYPFLNFYLLQNAIFPTSKKWEIWVRTYSILSITQFIRTDELRALLISYLFLLTSAWEGASEHTALFIPLLPPTKYTWLNLKSKTILTLLLWHKAWIDIFATISLCARKKSLRWEK